MESLAGTVAVVLAEAGGAALQGLERGGDAGNVLGTTACGHGASDADGAGGLLEPRALAEEVVDGRDQVERVSGGRVEALAGALGQGAEGLVAGGLGGAALSARHVGRAASAYHAARDEV